jgi:hypothetical protein
MNIDTKISSQFFDKYKEVKVVKLDTLFELSFEDIQRVKETKRCPKCGNKLKIPRVGKVAVCNNTKVHYKPFVIGKEKL